MNAAWIVFRKELVDALRDRRTWFVVLLSSLLAGPVSLLLIASFVSSAEESAARREVIVANATAAPVACIVTPSTGEVALVSAGTALGGIIGSFAYPL